MKSLPPPQWKSWLFHKAIKKKDFFFFFISSVFQVAFSEIFTLVGELQKAFFLKISRKLAQNRDSEVDFPVFPLFDSHYMHYVYPTLIFIPYDLRNIA